MWVLVPSGKRLLSAPGQAVGSLGASPLLPPSPTDPRTPMLSVADALAGGAPAALPRGLRAEPSVIST